MYSDLGSGNDTFFTVEKAQIPWQRTAPMKNIY